MIKVEFTAEGYRLIGFEWFDHPPMAGDRVHLKDEGWCEVQAREWDTTGFCEGGERILRLRVQPLP